MSDNKSNEEVAPKKIQNTDELINAEDASMQDGDGISIYWGDEWNIEKGEERKKEVIPKGGWINCNFR
ncbi:hypothetical protein [Bacillus paranthracis]|uniref:hypothetical protein n=1 Tax=Bacillus paranthracis TaxID=2026186 RepID=UPI00202CCE6D|nr:hypothetical protein [Bacillus paranthracis]